MLFATGEEKGKEDFYCIFMVDFEPWEGIACFKNE